MTTTILLQAGGLSIQNLIPLGLIVLVMYFFMIRPQMKKQKDQKKFADELKKGDKVITTAGLHGRIAEVNETTVVIDTELGSKLRFDKTAISLDASKPLNTPAK
ncbi:preprotein translocase subunit YajC [Mucilaginibacter auburnensis]|uniref:Sec translocon accessory complex subunit YajC n=1 Tax=Mucilaginibacter auburnensis TaxID=1457233 RepID=A0A2H9VU18_9SPHI|nr:preprotein translocase subunit YajC [Mucilaginibacter auburnensis]PJJ84326.1 preprotein translocase subunit YajC [Mucilaginibacter auburnensis]